MVIDLCAGCGIGAIVAVKAGAHAAMANDICAYACAATAVNAQLNDVGDRIVTDSRNLIGSEQPFQAGDLMLVGDALYDAELADVLLPWLRELVNNGVDVYLGDPGRWVLTEMSVSERENLMTPVAKYELPQTLAQEHSGITSVTVHKLRGGDVSAP